MISFASTMDSGLSAPSVHPIAYLLAPIDLIMYMLMSAFTLHDG